MAHPPQPRRFLWRPSPELISTIPKEFQSGDEPQLWQESTILGTYLSRQAYLRPGIIVDRHDIIMNHDRTKSPSSCLSSVSQENNAVHMQRPANLTHHELHSFGGIWPIGLHMFGAGLVAGPVRCRQDHSRSISTTKIERTRPVGERTSATSFLSLPLASRLPTSVRSL